jgi:hypothetical protein
MNKQTAVEWLHETFVKATQTELKDNVNLFFKQAKEMEKEQIISAYRTGCEKTIVYEIKKQENDDVKRLTSKGYYNETYSHN